MLLVTAGFYSLPVWLMENQGFASQNGLTLTSAQFQSGSGAASVIFAGGTGDVSGGGMDLPVVLHQKYHMDVTVIGDMFQTNSFALVSKAGSKYKTLQDLKGQVIGITGAGAWSNYLVDYQIKQAGLDPKDFKVTPLGGIPNQMAALESDKAAAVITQAPQQQENASKTQVIADWVDATKYPAPALVFTARSSQVQKDPGAYAAFVKAYAAAVSKMEKDRTWAAQMATQSGLAGSVTPAALQIELDQYLGPQDKPCTGIWSCTGAFNEAMYNEGKKLLTGSGFFPETDFPTFTQLTQYAPKT
ncbi:MAG: ABC transporter substrate-binding protein [Chloroflexota bacterium]|nr:ABC transporter substrate-binding protein [Chloroflexota bacterium]